MQFNGIAFLIIEERCDSIWIFVTSLFRKSIFRPSAAPSHSLPFGARSVGHYCITEEDREHPRKKNFIQIFWTIRGRGRITRNHQFKPFGPGEVAFYFPGDMHDLRPYDPSPWEYRWWTMDGPLALSVVKSFGFLNNKIYKAKLPPKEWFVDLERCTRNVTLVGELRASAIAFQLLTEIAIRARPHKRPDAIPRFSDDFQKKAMDLMHAHWQNPALGVEQLADSLHMHRAVFFRRFHAAFGIAPSDYLMRWRIQNALSLLKETQLPIHEIAQTCGWTDPNYFSRCIRKATGHSPRHFRNI